MSSQIVIVTSSIVTADERERFDGPLLRALERRGVTATSVCWDDAAHDWAATDVAVIRSTWDYFDRREEFLAWAEQTGSVTRLENTVDVLKWNTHKSYLLELEDRGAPTLPTAWVAQGDRVDVAELAADRSWSELIIKPAVDGGAMKLMRTTDLVAAQAHLDALVVDGDAMIQPYLSTVESFGELSVLFIDGRFTHAVRKIPASGDFRVQEHYEAEHVAVEPDPDALALARWVVETSGHEYLYARVDLLQDVDGSWLLIELEATEPNWYFETVPEAAEPFADAIVRRLDVLRTT